MSGPLRVTAGCDSTSVYLRARAQGGRLWDHGVGVGVSEKVCTSHWSGAAALGACMSRCQQ